MTLFHCAVYDNQKDANKPSASIAHRSVRFGRRVCVFDARNGFADRIAALGVQ